MPVLRVLSIDNNPAIAESLEGEDGLFKGLSGDNFTYQIKTITGSMKDSPTVLEKVKAVGADFFPHVALSRPWIAWQLGSG